MRVLKKIVVLLAVFVGSLIVFTFLLNMGSGSAGTTNATACSEPTIYINMEDTLVNPMEGYKSEINESTYRDSVTLLSSDRKISVAIKAYGRDVESLSYQVTSVTDGTVVENGKVKSLTQTDDTLTGEFELNTPVNMNMEYMLRFTLDLGDDTPIYYYTRLLQRNGQNMSWYLEYVQEFYQNCINKNLTDAMIAQLETNAKSQNSSMHYVTLESARSQITWGDMEVSLVEPANITVLEINETTVSIGLDYVVSSVDEQGKTEYYTVNDYYRMRKAQDNVVLLDYERTADELFDGDRDVLTDSGINVGITGKDIVYQANDEGTAVAFIQDGELWEYNRSANKTVRIYGFRADGNVDMRTENDSHGISISSVDASGNVFFVVYGYIVSGEHEGQLGISVCKYDAERNTTNELAFIETKDSYEMMKQSVAKLAYVNDKNECFVYYNNTIYMLNLEDDSISILQDNLEGEDVSVSDSQNLVAWSESEDGGLPTHVKQLNLKTGEVIAIDAPSGEYIRSRGYIGEELIYGIARAEDCYTDASGTDMFIMYRVCVISAEGEIVKDYQQDNVYISSITTEDNLIVLKRLQKNEGVFSPLDDDRVLHYEPQEESTVSVELNVSDRKGTEVYLTFTSAGATTNLLNVYAGISETLNSEVLSESTMVYGSDYYYVYAKGGLYGLYEHANSAIMAADEQLGIVLGPNQRYVWERGNIKTSNKMDISTLPQGILSIPSDEASMAAAVGEEYDILNLGGCSLSEIKYQLSNGCAVTGKWSADENKLIVGYDTYNIWVYDVSTGGSTAIALEDAEAAFGGQGNLFLSYTEKQ